MRYVKRLNEALAGLLADDPKIVLLGEDIADPYGGAFKVTRGLSTRFPERVFSTPVSEAGFTGVAVGLALKGFKPVVEIMFGDFITHCADQIVNHAAKLGWYRDPERGVPLVFRTPMGGGRGYGATHSQSLEKMFLGVPFVHVVAGNLLTDPGDLLTQALRLDRTVLFIEHKLHYGRELLDETADELGAFRITMTTGDFPTATIAIADGAAPQATLVAYGAMADLCLEASRRLFVEDEVEAEVVVPSRIKPFPLDPIMASVRRTGRLVVVEEGTEGFGWGAQVVCTLLERGAAFAAPPKAIAAAACPLAGSPYLEKMLLPRTDDIVAAVRSIMAGRKL
ncbi:MAG: transketolase C-terminal domain-containing protein [Elusimicrobiota bacterium]